MVDRETGQSSPHKVKLGKAPSVRGVRQEGGGEGGGGGGGGY